MQSYVSKLKTPSTSEGLEVETPSPIVRQPRLLILRGTPGSGKSTIAEHFETAGFFPISVDDFFTGVDGVYRFDPNKLKDAHAYCLNRIVNLLQYGKDVVVHNTFRTLDELHPYLILKIKGTYAIQIYRVISQYTSNKKIPDYVMKRHVEGYQPHPRERNVTYDLESKKLTFH